MTLGRLGRLTPAEPLTSALSDQLPSTTAEASPSTDHDARKAVTTMTTRPKTLLTIAEVLDEIDVPKSTFYRWLNTGRGPRSLKLPNGKRKVRRCDLDAWLTTFEQTAA